jgi:phenylacetate-coenzyme A ligase PaaK-like adenylate-forming protein
MLIQLDKGNTLMTSNYNEQLQKLLEEPVYSSPQAIKEQKLLPIFNLLHQHHVKNCVEYKNIALSTASTFNSLHSMPFLTVRLFKHRLLKSVDDDDIFRVLQSSGTSGQAPARIILDKQTSARQSKSLVKILQSSIGKQRLPMLIIDSSHIVNKSSEFSARAAGIQGMAFFGRDHTYALNENMQLDWERVDNFCQKYSDQPVLIFGFTFMVWEYFVKELSRQGRSIHLPLGRLLHSGGWKKLEAVKVDNSEFKRALAQVTKVQEVYNFYGMAEQVGTIFVECSEGNLHAPLLSDIIIRNPYTLKPNQIGESGLIQVLSALPTSYPGHSLLTEDLGTMLGIDDCSCGKKGKYFAVHGRLPKTEVRGCSDTMVKV